MFGSLILVVSFHPGVVFFHLCNAEREKRLLKFRSLFSFKKNSADKLFTGTLKFDLLLFLQFLCIIKEMKYEKEVAVNRVKYFDQIPV